MLEYPLQACRQTLLVLRRIQLCVPFIRLRNRLNDVQRHDINRMLQKQYGMLQWEQGSGKTLAAIAVGLHQMGIQGVHSTWVVSSAISIRNNWNVVLPNYGLPYVFVERLADLKRIRPGDFVLVTLGKLGQLRRHIKRWIKRHGQNVMLVLDESNEISNPDSVRAKATRSAFRRCRMKLLLQAQAHETISRSLRPSWNCSATTPSICSAGAKPCIPMRKSWT